MGVSDEVKDLGIQNLKLEISANKLQAFLLIPDQIKWEPTDVSEVLHIIQEKSGLYELNKSNITESINKLNEGKSCNPRILIAEGLAPVDGKNGSISWVQDFFTKDQVDDDLDIVDYRNISRIHVVYEGEVLAILTPPTQGIIGTDVFGKEIKARDGLPPAVKFGNSLNISDDGLQVTAKIPGQIFLKGGIVNIKEILEISGDVNYDIGKIDFPGTVIIKGSIFDGFSVKAGKQLRVNGLIEAANIESGEDMILKEGASGKNKGTIVCKGKLTTQFLDNISVRSDGDIEIKKEAINCHIFTKSKIVSPSASIIGGVLEAVHGGEVGTLGSDAMVKTQVVIGRDTGVSGNIGIILKKIESLESQVKQLQFRIDSAKLKISKAGMSGVIEPNIRERVMEDTFELDEKQEQLDQLEAEKAKEREESMDIYAQLLVKSLLYEGVSLEVAGKRIICRETKKGSVRVRYNPETENAEITV